MRVQEIEIALLCYKTMKTDHDYNSMSFRTCFEGHMQSKQDFLLGVEQSHISAIDKKQAQRQHLSASLSFAQHDPQHSSDIHEGHMFIPCDCQMEIKNL